MLKKSLSGGLLFVSFLALLSAANAMEDNDTNVTITFIKNDTPVELLKKITKTPDPTTVSNEIILIDKGSRAQNCYWYAMDYIYQGFTEEIPDYQLGREKFLMWFEKHFERVDTNQQPGDLVIYFRTKNMGDIDHFGVHIKPNRVRSKWGQDPIYQHPLFYVPGESNYAKYFRLKSTISLDAQLQSKDFATYANILPKLVRFNNIEGTKKCFEPQWSDEQILVLIDDGLSAIYNENKELKVVEKFLLEKLDWVVTKKNINIAKPLSFENEGRFALQGTIFTLVETGKIKTLKMLTEKYPQLNFDFDHRGGPLLRAIKTNNLEMLQ